MKNNNIESTITLVTSEHSMHILPAFKTSTNAGLGAQLAGAGELVTGLARRWSIHRAGEAPAMTLAREQLSLLVSQHNKFVRNDYKNMFNVHNFQQDKSIRKIKPDKVVNSSTPEELLQVGNSPTPEKTLKVVKSETHVENINETIRHILTADLFSPNVSAEKKLHEENHVRKKLLPIHHMSDVLFEKISHVHQRNITHELLEQFQEKVSKVIVRSVSQEFSASGSKKQPGSISEKTTVNVDDVTSKVIDVLERRLRASRERRGHF